MDICRIREPPLEGLPARQGTSQPAGCPTNWPGLMKAGGQRLYPSGVLWVYRPTQAPGAATSSATSVGRSPFNVLKAYPFKYLTQTGPESDPDVLQMLGHTLVLNRLGPQAPDLCQRAFQRPDDIGHRYIRRRPRQVIARLSAPVAHQYVRTSQVVQYTPRNLLGICWSAAMASTVMGSEDVAKTSNARTP